MNQDDFLDRLLQVMDHVDVKQLHRLHQDLLLDNALQTVLTGTIPMAHQYAEDFLMNAIHLCELNCSEDALFQLETVYEILRGQSGLSGLDVITDEERQNHHIKHRCDTIKQDNNHVINHDTIGHPETDTRRMDQEHVD